MNPYGLRCFCVFVLSSALSTLALCQESQFTGKVVGVTDGDTIEVMRGGVAVKIRLHGIDTPEKNQDFGTKAKQFTSEAAFRQTVNVEVKDTDRYGRLVGLVTLPNRKILNHELVKAGLAWHYKEYAPRDAKLIKYQFDAQRARRGLWSQSNPVPPWDFRKYGKKRTVPVDNPRSTSTRVRDDAIVQTQTPTTEQYKHDEAGHVYTTDTGAKYHDKDCRTLARSKNLYSGTATDAWNQGYEPCAVCQPEGYQEFAASKQQQQQQQTFQQPAQQSTAGIVYVTNSGAKYHKEGCQYLRSSRNPIGLADAKAQGYTACSRCKPK